MQEYKRRFIEFMVEAEVLSFGDFTTKSGRETPFFVNTGRYRTGRQMKRLAEFYVDAIEASGVGFDFLFGPAYKGIPLVVAISVEFAHRGKDIPFTFNRKEEKDHGEGGRLVGHRPVDGERALIVEDVTTAGTSIRETVPQMRAAAAVELAGLCVSVDRMERGSGTRNALAEVAAEFQMPAFSIVDVEEVMRHLRGVELNGRVPLSEELHERMVAYRQRYGGVA